MGSSKDVMEVFAERDIHQLFSEYDGWNVATVAGTKPAGRFYRITRGKWVGVETAFIAASFDMVPREELISTLNALPDGQGSLTKKYLLTPQAADTSDVPPHIRILRMNAFAFSEGKLIWLTKKKNAISYPPTECTPAPTPITQE
ncbi:MAG: hypothetical protein M0Q92_13430 [Methanoregula sp.]|jgi:hypothetical protein|nr:hypothetical protein [Methanoregula sp.]